MLGAVTGMPPPTGAVLLGAITGMPPPTGAVLLGAVTGRPPNGAVRPAEATVIFCPPQ